MGRYERVYDDMGGYDNLRNIKVTKRPKVGSSNTCMQPVVALWCRGERSRKRCRIILLYVIHVSGPLPGRRRTSRTPA